MSRRLYRSGVAALALTISLSTLPNQANAVVCRGPGDALADSIGTDIPEIVLTTMQQVTSIANEMSSFIGQITPIVSAVGTGVNAVTGGCTDLMSCMQQYFSQLAATNTNNQVMNSSVVAKGNDFLATNQYTMQLQGAQAGTYVQNGVGTGTGGSNNLQYMNNVQCVPATLSTGAATASYNVDKTVGHDPGGDANYVFAKGGASPEYAFSAHTQVKDITTLFNAAVPFYSATTDIQGTSVLTHNDSNIEYLMGQDIFSVIRQPDGTYIDQGTTDLGAMQMYASYILGLHAEPPPGGTNPKNDPQDLQFTAAASEKNAFWSLAALPLQEETALHIGFTNPAAQSITDLYTAGNLPLNISGAAPDDVTSRAALLKAMFRLPAENPNTFVSIGTLVELKALQYIAGVMLLGNYLKYERYLVEKQDLLVYDGILALQMRQMNFVAHP